VTNTEQKNCPTRCNKASASGKFGFHHVIDISTDDVPVLGDATETSSSSCLFVFEPIVDDIKAAAVDRISYVAKACLRLDPDPSVNDLAEKRWRGPGLDQERESERSSGESRMAMTGLSESF